MELCSMLCGSLDERQVWGRMDTCICMTESLHCSPETATTLLIFYTPIQNVFGVKKNKNLKINYTSIKKITNAEESLCLCTNSVTIYCNFLLPDNTRFQDK